MTWQKYEDYDPELIIWDKVWISISEFLCFCIFRVNKGANIYNYGTALQKCSGRGNHRSQQCSGATYRATSRLHAGHDFRVGIIPGALALLRWGEGSWSCSSCVRGSFGAAATLCITEPGEGELLTAVLGERMRQEAEAEIKGVMLGST